jgi:hypothetical protein
MSLRQILATIALFVVFVVCFLGPLFLADAFAKCRTHACWHRVHLARHVRYVWRWYHAHPMPYCTWAYESGTWGSPWRSSRYRARNSQSTAGGKFQIIDRTWFAYGGRPNGDRYPAAAAPPLEQEKIARRILASQGLGAWARC